LRFTAGQTFGGEIAGYLNQGVNAGLVLSTVEAGTSTERIRITPTGVGIGTTSPSEFVELYKASGSCNLRVTSGASSGNLAQSGTDTYLTNGSNGPIQLWTNGNERARIDSSGRLLVGTSSARSNFFNSTSTALIQAEGIGGGSSRGMVSIVNNSTSGDPPWLLIAKSGGASIGSNTLVSNNEVLGVLGFGGNDGSEFVNAAYITAEVDGTPGANDMPGRLVFSTTADGASSPTKRLAIFSNGAVELTNGSLYLAASAIGSGAGTNAVRYSTATGLISYDSSSRLIKDDIVDCPYGIEALKQLQPRKYFRTDDRCTEIGFIADEVSAVMPEFVPFGPKSVITQDDKDTEQIPLGVNYDKITAVLTKALQEAIAKIETLEAKVAAFEAV
jgi:hypothetical protein